MAWQSNQWPRWTPTLLMPSGLDYRLGSCRHDLAELLTVMGRVEEAEQQRRQSLAAWESAGTPVAATFPHGKGLAHYRLGELLHQTGRTAEADSSVRCRPRPSWRTSPPARGIDLPLAADLPVGQLPG